MGNLQITHVARDINIMLPREVFPEKYGLPSSPQWYELLILPPAMHQTTILLEVEGSGG